MNTSSHITGIILAGGKSSRMGTDKGLVKWKEKTFTEHIICALEKVSQEVRIISNNETYKRFGLQVHADLFPEKGPLGGIYTGLYYSQTGRNLVVSCDTPLVGADLLKRLLLAAGNHEVCITADHDGRWEPLVGYYHRNCLASFGERIRNNRLKVEEAIRQTDHLVIQPEGVEEQLKNINTKEDLKDLI